MMDKDKLLELLEDYLADADKIVIEKKTKAPKNEPEDTAAFNAALNDILGKQHADDDKVDED